MRGGKFDWRTQGTSSSQLTLQGSPGQVMMTGQVRHDAGDVAGPHSERSDLILGTTVTAEYDQVLDESRLTSTDDLEARGLAKYLDRFHIRPDAGNVPRPPVNARQQRQRSVLQGQAQRRDARVP